jgi:hypothetical protein
MFGSIRVEIFKGNIKLRFAIVLIFLLILFWPNWGYVIEWLDVIIERVRMWKEAAVV